MDPLHIPDHWSAEQALDIIDFLENLVDAIWMRHGWMMRAVLRERYEPIDPSPIPEDTVLDDEIPF